MSIRKLEARKLEALREYHRIAAECDAEIENIRKARGVKSKDYSNDPNWAYADIGRNAVNYNY